MSETLWAVVITGSVTLLATWIGPMLTERSAAKRERAGRTAAAAQELRPLGLDAIQATTDAINLTYIGLQAAQSGSEAVREFSKREDRGRADLRDAYARAARALVELELRTGDALVNEVAGNLTATLQTASNSLYWVHAGLFHGGPLNMAGARVVELAEDAAMEGVNALKFALQPLTAPEDFQGTLRPEAAKAVERMRQTLESLGEVTRGDSGDFTGTEQP